MGPAEEFIAVALYAVNYIAADDGLDLGSPFIVANPRFIEFDSQDVVNIGLHLPGLFPAKLTKVRGILAGTVC